MCFAVVLSGCSASSIDYVSGGTSTDNDNITIDNNDDEDNSANDNDDEIIVDDTVIDDDSADDNDDEIIVDDTIIDDDNADDNADEIIVDDTVIDDDLVDDTVIDDDNADESTPTDESTTTDDNTPTDEDVTATDEKVELTSSQVTTIAARSAVSIVATFVITTTTTSSKPGSSSTSTDTTYSFGGSGTIIKLDESTGEAYILTNYHVIYEYSANSPICDNITIYPYGNATGLEATYVGGEGIKDIAILKVSANDILNSGVYRATDFAESETTRIGDMALTVGFPLGMGLSATTGIISVESEIITITSFLDGTSSLDQRYMRIDTAINSGNSGGGLYNQYGECIGVVSAKTTTDSVDSFSYAIPVSVAKGVLGVVMDQQMTTDGEYYKYLLGITVQATDQYAVLNGDTIEIVQVCEASVVSSASISYGTVQVGDIFVSMALSGGEDTSITKYYQVGDIMYTVRAGDTITFTVERDGQTITLDPILASMDYISVL